MTSRSQGSRLISWDNPCLWAKLWTSTPSRGGDARRKRPSKTALVLGGGGFTGGVYEIGALRALDLLAVNSTVNNFDIYVGTSAGSFVAGDARQRDHPRRDDAGAQRAASPPSWRTSTSTRC